MAKARVAIIKENHTWEELTVETDGANYAEAAANAEFNARMKITGDHSCELPSGTLAVKCLSITQTGSPE